MKKNDIIYLLSSYVGILIIICTLSITINVYCLNNYVNIIRNAKRISVVAQDILLECRSINKHGIQNKDAVKATKRTKYISNTYSARYKGFIKILEQDK